MSDGVMLDSSSDLPVDLLLFQVGEEIYGADAQQVLRIDRPEKGALALPSLGALKHGGRVLVFRAAEGEGQLKVDAVLGVKTARSNELRRLPPAARREPCAIGVWLEDNRPIVLVDLVKTLTSQGRL